MICEKVIVGEGTQFPLDGMLTFPDDISLPVPAVVMVHGSGASNMDEKVMALSPFKDLAEGLAAHGVASLRYDKRTFTYGKQMAKMDATASVETIDDAILALEILKNDSRIDSSRIYVLGHSMGAMLAPRIDAEWGNAAGLIMLAGTPYRLEDIVLRQAMTGSEYLLRPSGAALSIEEDKSKMIRVAYQYIQENRSTNYGMRWSDWLPEHTDAEMPEPDNSDVLYKETHHRSGRP